MPFEDLKGVNPWMPVEKHQNMLPHWQQEGAAYMVTFHLGDSLPQELLRKWTRERNDWLEENPRPWTDEQQNEYHRLFTSQKERWLDAGHGSCVLGQPGIAGITERVLMHFDGIRYLHWSWVIMPNHVHALFTLLPGNRLEDTLKSWKGVSARQINTHLAQSGELWQKDYWDRLIRDAEHFTNCVRYIRRNPIKAKLRPTDFILHEHADVAALHV